MQQRILILGVSLILLTGCSAAPQAGEPAVTSSSSSSSSSVAVSSAHASSVAAPSSESSRSSSVATSSVARSSAASSQVSWTLEALKNHATRQSCFVAINGGVYDLTAYIDRHPAGDTMILKMCGKDATAAFAGNHGGDPQKEALLETFRIGTVQ